MFIYKGNKVIYMMKNVVSGNDKKAINYSINALKCIAIFAVIIIHCRLYRWEGDFGKILDTISRFAVPVFFLISGFYSFYTDENYALKKYEKRIVRLIILIIVSNLFYILSYWIADPNFNLMTLFTFEKIISYIFFNVAPSPGYHLWFLQALLYCYLFFWIMTKLEMDMTQGYFVIPLLLSIALIYSELFVLMGIKIDFSHYRNFLYMGLPIFYLGYYIHDKQDKIKEISNRLIILAIIISIFLTLVESIIIPGKMDLSLASLLLAISLFILCVNNPNHDIPVVSWIGGNLYTSMYILHLWVIKFVLTWLKIDLGYINLIIYFAVTSSLSFVIYVIKQALITNKNPKENAVERPDKVYNEKITEPNQSIKDEKSKPPIKQITDEEAKEMLAQIRAKVIKEMEEEQRQMKK